VQRLKTRELRFNIHQGIQADRAAIIDADQEALEWLTQQSSADTKSGADANVRYMSSEASNVNLNIGLMCGSYGSVARMMDEIATIPGMAGVLLTFDEFVSGTETFGERIQPLMKSRRHIASAAPSVAEAAE